MLPHLGWPLLMLLGLPRMQLLAFHLSGPYLNTAAAAAKSLQSCPTVWLHRWKPTRLPRPWDSPGKNTGVGCHVLLQCMKVKSEREVAQSCPTLSDPMDYSSPGSSIHGIFQARLLEWGASILFPWIIKVVPPSLNLCNTSCEYTYVYMFLYILLYIFPTKKKAF